MTGPRFRPRRSNAVPTTVALVVAIGMVCALGCGLLCGGMGWLR